MLENTGGGNEQDEGEGTGQGGNEQGEGEGTGQGGNEQDEGEGTGQGGQSDNEERPKVSVYRYFIEHILHRYLDGCIWTDLVWT